MGESSPAAMPSGRDQTRSESLISWLLGVIEHSDRQLILFAEEDSLDPNAFRTLIERLTGTPIKELSEDEKRENNDLLEPVIADDNRELDCSQFNELLLLVNKDRVEPAFYRRFFPERALVSDLMLGVERFRKVAMLQYGNFVHAYRKLSRMGSIEALDHELRELLTESPDPAAPFLSRSPKVIDVEHIPRNDTPLVGYLSVGLLDREEKAAKLLMAATKDGTASKDWDAYTDLVSRSVQPALATTAHAVVSAFRRRSASSGIGDFATFLDSSLPRIVARAGQGVQVQKKAAKNQDIYLTWDHMDVYFATSMRKPWEFYDLYGFIADLMTRPELSDLRLRHFDPTQCFTKLPADKGLVECLMLKRAKCTVYSVQDSDTLGKDSELAATLAQGKPVIAFVPEIDVADRAGKLFEENPAAVLERLRFVLYADENFMAETGPEEYSFVAEYKGLHDCILRMPFRSIPDDATDEFRAADRSNLERLCKIVAAAEKRIYDRRAMTLKHSHPLALQVNLDTGVANGVLVVRTVEDCARLLRSVLTRTMDFALRDENGMWCLREAISGCAFRVTTKNRKIDNCFWNFYLRDASND